MHQGLLEELNRTRIEDLHREAVRPRAGRPRRSRRFARWRAAGPGTPLAKPCPGQNLA